METFLFHTITFVLDIIYYIGFIGIFLFNCFATMMAGMAHGGEEVGEMERRVKERSIIYIFALIGKLIGFFLPFIYPYYIFDISFKIILTLIFIVFCLRIKFNRDKCEIGFEYFELSHAALTALRILEFLYVILNF